MLTIERARELLGPDGDGMTDAEVEQLTAAIDTLADLVLDVCIDKHRKTTLEKKVA